MPEINNEGKEFWDKNPCGGKWLSYGKKIEWLKEKEPYFLNFLRADLLENKNVLDVGCGQGFILSIIAQKAKKATGIDISAKSLEQARKGLRELDLRNVELLLGDAEKLPFENEAFNTVFSFGVLHHTAKTNEAINEIRRVLKKNGTAVIMFYRKYTPKWFMVRFFRAVSWIFDFFSGEKWWLAKKMRASDKFYNSNIGTAALELFGCPVLKTYSNSEIKKIFKDFKNFNIFCEQPGFSRTLDIVPIPLLKKFFNFLDNHFKNSLGFYIIIEAKK